MAAASLGATLRVTDMEPSLDGICLLKARISDHWKKRENRLVVSKEEGGGSGMDGEFGVSRCKLQCLGWISNEVLLYSTGNYIQSLEKEHDGR